jgi:signal transduction histidine kinase
VGGLRAPEPEQGEDSNETLPATAQPDVPLVLVVEDNREMGRFVKELLAKEYRTAVASDGREGLEKALDLRPNLIVCDVMMPRMSGEKMVQELRSRPEFADTPIVMLTAKADDDLRANLLGEYVQDYVTKPIRGAELLARVRNLVGAQQREAALRQSQKELRNLAGRLVSAQEQERARVARELHDGLNQRLAAATINVGALQNRLSEPPDLIRQYLGQLEQQLAGIADEVRWISHQLHPPALEHVGLASALQSHCSEFEAQTGIPTTFVLQNDPPPLPPDVASGLFRITQEALQNVAKHAGASQARVTLCTEEDLVSLSVSDNGNGFDRAEARAKQGLGLVSMEERARLFGGSLSLESGRGQGTTIEVHIPQEMK